MHFFSLTLSMLLTSQLFSETLAIGGASVTPADKNEIISLHNNIRRSHSNTPGLHWNSLLALEAKIYVENCQYNDNSKVLSLLKESLAVDNVAKGYANWEKTINAWYSGNKDYDYDNPGYTNGAGAFITMVWKDSTDIGCSAMNCSDIGVLYQCLYSPSIPVPLVLDPNEYEKNVRPSA